MDSVKTSQIQTQTDSPHETRGSTSSQVALTHTTDGKLCNSRDKEPISSIAPAIQRERSDAIGSVAAQIPAYSSTTWGHTGGGIGSGTVNSSANVSACSSRRSSSGARRRLANLRATTTKSFCIDEELEERALIERLKVAQRQQTFDLDEPVPEADDSGEALAAAACAGAAAEFDFDSRVVPHALLGGWDKGYQSHCEPRRDSECIELADYCHATATPSALSSARLSNVRTHSSSPPSQTHLHPTVLELRGRLANAELERTNSGPTPYSLEHQATNPTILSPSRAAPGSTSKRAVPRKFSVPLRHPQLSQLQPQPQLHPQRPGVSTSSSHLPPMSGSGSINVVGPGAGAGAIGNSGFGSHHRAGTCTNAHSRAHQHSRAAALLQELHSASFGSVRRRVSSSGGMDLGGGGETDTLLSSCGSTQSQQQLAAALAHLKSDPFARRSNADSRTNAEAACATGEHVQKTSSQNEDEDGEEAGDGDEEGCGGVQVTVTAPASDQPRGSRSSLHVPAPLTVAIDEPVITTAQVQLEVEGGKAQSSYSAFLKDHVTRFFQPGDNKLGATSMETYCRKLHLLYAVLNLVPVHDVRVDLNDSFKNVRP